MKFYEIPTPNGPQLVDTQAEAKAAGVKNPQPVEVPTDKDGLRNYVNDLKARAFNTLHGDDPDPTGQLEAFASGVQGHVVVERPEGPPLKQLGPETDGLHPMSAKAILKDMDEIMKPKPRIAEKMFDPDDVQEIILNSRGFQLNNYFGACLEAAERVLKDVRNQGSPPQA